MQKNKTLILIAGGSGSGKTTLVKAIEDIVKENKTTISFFRQDDYYHNQDNISIEERKEVNYDHPKEFEWDRMIKDIKMLLNGKDIETPKYIHTDMTHSKTEIRKIKSSDVIIIEGIFALYNKKITELGDIKIFVDASSDVRLMRRIKRDVFENGKDINYLLKQWEDNVKPMFEAFIRNTKDYADIIVPNSLGELNNVAIDIIRTKIISLMK